MKQKMVMCLLAGVLDLLGNGLVQGVNSYFGQS